MGDSQNHRKQCWNGLNLDDLAVIGPILWNPIWVYPIYHVLTSAEMGTGQHMYTYYNMHGGPQMFSTKPCISWLPNSDLERL